MPRSPAVRIEVSGSTSTVVLARPAVRNAVDGPTAQALADVFHSVEADSGIAAAVLWGEGKTFCSGAGLKAVGTPRGNRLSPRRRRPHGPHPAPAHQAGGRRPSGHAVAGGLELALWCDLRIAEEDAVFGVFCRRWGVPLVDGGTVRLPRVVGAGRAADLVLTGRPVPAREAHEIGLADRLVPPGQARTAAEELAAGLARFPQTCLRTDLASLRTQAGLTEPEAPAEEFAHAADAVAAAGEGAARFSAGAGRHGTFDQCGACPRGHLTEDSRSRFSASGP